MATQEFYIRKADETDARGPFNMEQLASLAENGQMDPATLYYEAATEQWTPLRDNTELLQVLFPQKKILRVSPKASIASLNVEHELDKPITVQDMLAAADGRTEDTKDKLDPDIASGRAAVIGRYAAIATSVVTAATFVIPAIPKMLEQNWAGLLETPLVFVGLVDLFFVLVLLLGATTVYPLIRFRATVVLGYLGFMLYAGENLPLLAAAAAASVGLYLCTVALNLTLVLIAAILGVGGAVMLALHYLA